MASFGAAEESLCDVCEITLLTIARELPRVTALLDDVDLSVVAELTCPICANTFEDGQVLWRCGHGMCHGCISQQFSEKVRTIPFSSSSSLCSVCPSSLSLFALNCLP